MVITLLIKVNHVIGVNLNKGDFVLHGINTCFIFIYIFIYEHKIGELWQTQNLQQ